MTYCVAASKATALGCPPMARHSANIESHARHCPELFLCNPRVILTRPYEVGVARVPNFTDKETEAQRGASQVINGRAGV